MCIRDSSSCLPGAPSAHRSRRGQVGIRTNESPPDAESGLTDRLDVAIVGGGPAGLTASIWLARYLHSVVVVDSGDPRNWETRGINGFLGHPDIRPAQLRGIGREEARKYGVH